MPRRRKPDSAELIRRLVAVKVMVASMKDAMPAAARELRRQAGESIDDIIEDLR
ncbi:hypothetical protein GG804_26195 [Sphingomonas histidinilytica]|jgi:hypothetical protein|uniref:hypothetical protein n=1 Tax=Rhizorhabdus histidinilytica TaxID=439228 RepID=UPI001ADC77C5|nr:hypothetical protein [Rhizorhabdus histidinilytica]MBO9380260.1 hypothetical protein [Rhizorhabdus histidinilytica]